MSIMRSFSGAMLSALQAICKLSFGSFGREEFKKFLRLGLLFAVIIGVYWTLRPLKDAIFIDLVDKYQLPYAKTVSLLCLLPIVMFYTKLLERVSRERMFTILSMTYGTLILVFAVVMFWLQDPAVTTGDASTAFKVMSKSVGYIWYVFVESFGSLIVALFWAFSADTTGPDSAKRGFPLVVALGQFGGIILPWGIGGLPKRLGMTTDVLAMVILAGLTLCITLLVGYFTRATPKELLESFHGKNESKVESEQEPGFLEGLKLLLRHPYLIAIFAAIAIYEVIVTIFDFNFKVAASEVYSKTELSAYLSWYGSVVNLVALICLIFGISNVTRFLGVGIALAAMPIIVGLALLGFLTVDSLSFLFSLMVGSKAINYALNGPALKQLYIPTTPDVRFKAQAWIETFGSRASKQIGSTFNMTLAPLQSALGAIAGKARYIALSGYIGGFLLIVWFFAAIFLGRKFKKAVDSKSVIC